MEKETVILKGTKDGILIILDDQKDFIAVKKRLDEKLSAAGQFFFGAQVIIDIGERMIVEKEMEEIASLMRDRYGLTLLRVISKREKEEIQRKKRKLLGNEKIESAEEFETLFLKRTLRSGQSIHFEGNVVVFGDVNPGAEIVAAGDIIVIGSLRGVAHAGAKGYEKAVVYAHKLLPMQLRIAETISRAPDDDEVKPELPEIARIRNGAVVIESYYSRGEKNKNGQRRS